MLTVFLILPLKSLFWTRVWYSLKIGRSFCMIPPLSFNISLIFRPSLTWTTANIEICEPPGQNAMRSVGTDNWSFSKNLSHCILFSNIGVWAPSFTTTGTPKPISLMSWSRFSYVTSRFSHGSRCLIDEFSSRGFAGAKELLHLLESAFFQLRYSW